MREYLRGDITTDITSDMAFQSDNPTVDDVVGECALLYRTMFLNCDFRMQGAVDMARMKMSLLPVDEDDQAVRIAFAPIVAPNLEAKYSGHWLSCKVGVSETRLYVSGPPRSKLAENPFKVVWQAIGAMLVRNGFIHSAEEDLNADYFFKSIRRPPNRVEHAVEPPPGVETHAGLTRIGNMTEVLGKDSAEMREQLKAESRNNLIWFYAFVDLSYNDNLLNAALEKYNNEGSLKARERLLAEDPEMKKFVFVSHGMVKVPGDPLQWRGLKYSLEKDGFVGATMSRTVIYLTALAINDPTRKGMTFTKPIV